MGAALASIVMRRKMGAVEQLFAQLKAAAARRQWKTLVRDSDEFWSLANAIREDPAAYSQFKQTVRNFMEPSSAAFILDMFLPVQDNANTTRDGSSSGRNAGRDQASAMSHGPGGGSAAVSSVYLISLRQRRALLRMLGLRCVKRMLRSDAFWDAISDRQFLTSVLDCPWSRATQALDHDAIQTACSVLLGKHSERIVRGLGDKFSSRVELFLADAQDILYIIEHAGGRRRQGSGGSSRSGKREHRSQRSPTRVREKVRKSSRRPNAGNMDDSDSDLPFLRLYRLCQLVCLPSVQALLRDPRFAQVFGGRDDGADPDILLNVAAAYHRCYPGPSTPTRDLMLLSQTRPSSLLQHRAPQPPASFGGQQCSPTSAMAPCVVEVRPWLAWFCHWLHSLLCEPVIIMFLSLLGSHLEVCREIYICAFNAFLVPATRVRVAQHGQKETPLSLFTFTAGAFLLHAVMLHHHRPPDYAGGSNVQHGATAAVEQPLSGNTGMKGVGPVSAHLPSILFELDLWRSVALTLRGHFAAASSRRDAMHPEAFAAIMSQPRMHGLAVAFAEDRFFLARCFHHSIVDTLRVFAPIMHRAPDQFPTNCGYDADFTLRWSVTCNFLHFAADLFNAAPSDALPFFNMMIDADVNYSLLSLAAYYVGYFDAWPIQRQDEEQPVQPPPPHTSSTNGIGTDSKNIFGLVVLEVLNLVSLPSVVDFMKRSTSFWVMVADERWWRLLLFLASSSTASRLTASNQFFLLLNDSESALSQVFVDIGDIFREKEVMDPVVHSWLRLISLVVTYRVHIHGSTVERPNGQLVSMFTSWGMIYRISTTSELLDDMLAFYNWVTRESVLSTVNGVTRIAIPSHHSQRDDDDWMASIVNAFISSAPSLSVNLAELLDVAPCTCSFLSASSVAKWWWPDAYATLFDSAGVDGIDGHGREPKLQQTYHPKAYDDDANDIVRELWIKAGMATARICQNVGVSDAAKDLCIASLHYLLEWWACKFGLARSGVDDARREVFPLCTHRDFPHLVSFPSDAAASVLFAEQDLDGMVEDLYEANDTTVIPGVGYYIHGAHNALRMRDTLDKLTRLVDSALQFHYGYGGRPLSAAVKRETALLSFFSELLPKPLVRTVLSMPQLWPTMATIRIPDFDPTGRQAHGAVGGRSDDACLHSSDSSENVPASSAAVRALTSFTSRVKRGSERAIPSMAMMRRRRKVFSRMQAQYAWLRELLTQEAVRSLMNGLVGSDIAVHMAGVFSFLTVFLAGDMGQVLISAAASRAPPLKLLAYILSFSPVHSEDTVSGQGDSTSVMHAISPTETAAATAWRFLSDRKFWQLLFSPEVVDAVADGQLWRVVATMPKISLSVLSQLDSQYLFSSSDVSGTVSPGHTQSSPTAGNNLAGSAAGEVQSVLRRVSRTVRSWRSGGQIRSRL